MLLLHLGQHLILHLILLFTFSTSVSKCAENFAARQGIATGLEQIGIGDVSQEIGGIGRDIELHLVDSPARLPSNPISPINPPSLITNGPLEELKSKLPLTRLSHLITGAPSRISPPDITREATVELRGDPSYFPRLRGHVTLKQIKNGPVMISGSVVGLPRMGKFGIHFHQFPAPFPGQCQGVGEHYNPFLSSHGSKEHSHHHLGDEGNIIAQGGPLFGIAHIAKSDQFISLEPGAINSVLGLPLVIHLRPDDLGERGDHESRETGNSGQKIACGNVISRI